INLIALVLCRNSVIKRRMLFTLLVIGLIAALHFAGDYRVIAPTTAMAGLQKMLFALAVINTIVALAFNPWFADRIRDRAPAVVQDAIVVGLIIVVGLVAYQPDENFFAGSAIFAAVLGFALQETLGNAFAGLAIQMEKPFRVGHWVT